MGATPYGLEPVSPVAGASVNAAIDLEAALATPSCRSPCPAAPGRRRYRTDRPRPAAAAPDFAGCSWVHAKAPFIEIRAAIAPAPIIASVRIFSLAHRLLLPTVNMPRLALYSPEGLQQPRAYNLRQAACARLATRRGNLPCSTGGLELGVNRNAAVYYLAQGACRPARLFDGAIVADAPCGRLNGRLSR